ncbi:DNA polymerase III subunit gamma/tau [Terriglobus albidus]|uniref:DNA polymerase III subunit gamma/tau n=1 Tax=Terriglobus albidus TaxID=1592106 RepID=A0A5B9EDS5_9BACT|nr:DNA polymerase III subunit gamma/tau [Terriglobus albidus]QEE28541.1 DNA polymerase III subunit gamma/tau [Terriglobus albidus]
MAYQVLARKYRPLRFADVAGQDHVTRTLINALEQQRIAHGYIFSGHRGIGKTTIARILASALNCRNAIGSAERPTAEPCLKCDSCIEIRQGNAVDVIEIDAATNRGIDEIRELRDAARYRPARDRYKIYILDEAHQITDAAFNALLKTLEEPPDHIVFMMATTEPENIPQTIRSRCQHFSFHAVRHDDILAELRGIAQQEDVAADDAALALLAEAGDGSMRDALSIMDQAIASAPVVDGKAQLVATQIRDLMGSVPNTVFEEILEAVSANRSAVVIQTAARLLDAGNSPTQISRQFVRYLRNCVVAKIANLTEENNQSDLLQISQDERRRATRSSQLFTEEELTRFLQVMLRTFDDLGFRQEPRFHLELGLLKLVHLQRLLPVEDLLSQLPAPTGASSRPAAAAPPVRPATPPPARPSGGQPGSSTSATSAAPAKPAFSPFEADRSRKTEMSSRPTLNNVIPIDQTAGNLALAPEPVLPAAAPLPEVAAPVALVEPVVEAPSTPSPIAVPKPVAPSIAVFAEPVATPIAEPVMAPPPAPVMAPPATPVEVVVPAPAPVATAVATPTPTAAQAAGGYDIAALQNAIVNELSASKGHSSAADQMDESTFIIEGNELRVQTTLSAGMLKLLINAEAEKIIKASLRLQGAGDLKLVLLAGSAANAAAKKDRPAAAGSVKATAMEHPIVQQAQKLFNAEIRTVIDLREK